MTLRQISYLLAVADAGSFTVAARRLHISQPSLSQQIRALEAEIGGELLRRPPGPVRLTPAGRAFISEARTAVTSAQRAAEAARDALHMQIGELEVATVRSLAVAPLPDAIRRWQISHPGVSVHLHEYGHRDLVEESVLAGKSQVGIAPRPKKWSGRVQRLGWDELAVILPSGDTLLSRDRVHLPDLASRDWVLFEPGHGLHEICAWACRDAGFQAAGVAYTAQVEAAARLAAAGIGPALIPIKTVPADLVENMRRLSAPVVWELVAYTATHEWSNEAEELLEVLAEVEWVRRPPEGARRVDLDSPPGRRDIGMITANPVP